MSTPMVKQEYKLKRWRNLLLSLIISIIIAIWFISLSLQSLSYVILVLIFLLIFGLLVAFTLSPFKGGSIIISGNGIDYVKGRNIQSISWNEISWIKTGMLVGKKIIPIGYFSIVGRNKDITIPENYPSDPGFYYSVVLLFLNAGVNNIPFYDYGNLMNHRYIREMGFLFPGLYYKGEYFTTRRPKMAGPVIKDLRPCPKCKEYVLFMRIGRCPRCGYKLFKRRRRSISFK